MSKIPFLFLSLFFYASVTAQGVDSHQFTHYSPESGLLTNQVNSMIQDNEGFFWIASTDGLQRFDGVRYKNFRHVANDASTLPSNPVLQAIIDQRNNLWLLLADGHVGRFDRHSFRFQEVPVRPRNPISLTNIARRLVVDEWNNVFLVIGMIELIVWTEKADEFNYQNTLFHFTPEMGQINDFLPQPGTHKYWISTTGKKMVVFDLESGTVSYEGHNIIKEPAIDSINQFPNSFNSFFDRNHRLWFVTWGEYIPVLSCYDLQKKKFIVRRLDFAVTKRYYDLNGFMQQDDGTLWVRGYPILAKFIEAENRFQLIPNNYTNDHSISFEMITSLYEDRDKNFWIATNNHGIYRMNPPNELFTNVAHYARAAKQLGDGSPMSFMSTRWNTLIVGTWGDGMYHYDDQLRPIPMNIRNIDEMGGPFAWSMIESRDSNTIWMSSQPGLFKIDQERRVATHYNPPALTNRTIRQVAEDRFGNLWLGMQHIGVFKWNKAKGQKNFDDGISYFNAIPRTLINSITIDSRGWVWIATSNEGVYVVDPATDKVILTLRKDSQPPNQLAETGVSDVLEFNDSTVVLAANYHLMLYDPVRGTVKNIETSDLMSGMVMALEKDRKGNLWASTSSGLYRINLAKQIYTRFNTLDGIDNDHFGIGASYALPDGRLAFGNSTQFVIVNPDAIKPPPVVPHVVITDLRVQNKPERVDSVMNLPKLTLEADENNLQIEFSTLQYANGYVIKYMLENLDKDWRIADGSNMATYSYLPEGNYTFLVKAINEEGMESSQLTRLQIHVNPEIWNTWWFYTIIAVLAGGIFYYLDRERTRRKQLMEKMRNNLAGNLHQEVNMALNNINILSEMARIKAEKDIDKSKEYIEQIHAKSNTMIAALDDMLWSIDPANDHIRKTLSRINQEVALLNDKEGPDFEFTASPRINDINIDMQSRYEVFVLVKQLLNNLYKACTGKCTIRLDHEKAGLTFRIDIRKGECNMQLLNNLLQSQDLVQRMKKINATLNVDVKRNDCVVLLKVPV